ncbi:MAG: diacylglycerol kinase family protein [Candidatus Yonathbacteria bacterium]|nr:diacylglycerol kinase family protein [Candidatus Yonathbacteria bacterium]
MQKLIKSFQWAMNGIHTVWREEVNFRIESVIALAVLVSAFYLDFSMPEWIIIIGCIGAVLAAEIINTAVEDLCNKVEPNTDTVIGKIKDTMGGFVLVVCLTSAIIGVMIFSNYF